jgi:hypothetical protein
MSETSDLPAMISVGKVILEDSDGFLYDELTGEVVGHVETTTRARIDSEPDVDLALDFLARLEANLVAIKARRKALLENLTRLEKSAEARLRWWDFSFRSDILAFARRALGQGKAKTYRSAFGSVAFRATLGTHEILDDTLALGFVERWAPAQVKVVRSANITAVKQAIEAYRDQNEEDPSTAMWLRSTGPGEKATISTGLAGDR